MSTMMDLGGKSDNPKNISHFGTREEVVPSATEKPSSDVPDHGEPKTNQPSGGARTPKKGLSRDKCR